MSEEKVEDVSPDDEVAPFTYTITAYGADYPVDALVKRLDEGDVFVPTFQRGFVWTRNQADRFIESLLLGLPVPGLFLALEPDSQKLLVVDGQQRLTTLLRFYKGQWGDDVYRLRGVQQKFRDKTYKELPPEDRRRLDNAILHATVIRQDQPSDDRSSIYYVFERLNTGGTLLRPQEIRNSIYRGPFRDLIDALNKNAKWRVLYGPPSPRLKDEELILRFFALRHSATYTRPMKAFLNSYMGMNRNLGHESAELLTKEFTSSVEVISDAIGPQAFKPEKTLNAAVFDAIMLGIAARLAKGPITDFSALKTAHAALLQDPTFQKNYSRATADEESVKKRIELASSVFAGVA